MLITNTYVRFVPAQILDEDLEPSGDLHIRDVTIIIPTYCLRDTRMCLVPEAHVPRTS